HLSVYPTNYTSYNPYLPSLVIRRHSYQPWPSVHTLLAMVFALWTALGWVLDALGDALGPLASFAASSGMRSLFGRVMELFAAARCLSDRISDTSASSAAR